MTHLRIQQKKKGFKDQKLKKKLSWPSSIGKTDALKVIKEFPFTTSLNRKQFNSLREQVLISINSDQTLIFERNLQKIQPHKTTALNFVSTIRSRIKDSTFCRFKYIDKRGYRFILYSTYLFVLNKIGSNRRSSILETSERIWN
ncbi:hypothetical protein PHYBLDRAFT_69404 [Phycomyces blakesleeanus NRRL 1555(-)]|uniref:Uncharacterized protein n=1 Tax=Phycomyces blakesleeanus (strain ATCC 8743b / DSM 1359 / FGSC 10004 / NBRC 33097 / NRRL 1555) TaxID=763407 RepID=A0A167K9E7_PHYB8|nr:hypothetical protein PHYBLDRAFT_69404 [Phycomyces blakesleeanus NRRL 1555(-)]OAD67536.1 hypothetical protein PHYBLDRAFT_69404 [Phycomyces blakesleeanus NRRL 1555(-)]|eukprot:XP_018285576.1 hypothetical protein PHYBLDRAFT_69404 [Phycomyces blakesleeanus NRRL 1555(-)]